MLHDRYHRYHVNWKHFALPSSLTHACYHCDGKALWWILAGTNCFSSPPLADTRCRHGRIGWFNNLLKLIICHEQIHLRSRSDKKFGEKDSVANCQPTILQISPNSVIWPFGEWSLNPSWPPSLLWQFKPTKFGDLVSCSELWNVGKLSVYLLKNPVLTATKVTRNVFVLKFACICEIK